MKPDDDSGTGLLSFIDVLSCGLGAAAILLLVFAALPRDAQGAAARGASGAATRTNATPLGARDSETERLVQTPALRFVSFEGDALPDGEWDGVPEECEVLEERSVDRVSTLVFCPLGLSPERRLRAAFANPSGNCVVAGALDGSIVDSYGVTGQSAVTWVFGGEGKASIRAEGLSEEVACSTPTAARN